MMSVHVPESSGIFISYRRADATYPAGWLFDRLAARYDPSRVFKDVDSIHPGDDFAVTIGTALESCTIMLAVIGPRWLTVKSPGGRRLDDPDDYVRLEIETALTRQIRVIPILVDGARMPTTAELPASLAPLARRQAITLSQDRFSPDTDRLLRAIDAIITEATAPDPADAPSPHQIHPARQRSPAPVKRFHRPGSKTAIAISSAIIILAAGTLAAWHLTSRRADHQPEGNQPLAVSSRPYAPQSVEFSPGGTTLAIAALTGRNGRGQTYLVDLRTHAVTILRGRGSGSGVNAVGFSPDGRFLATGDGNATTYLWNLTGHPTITTALPNPDGEGVESVAFSPDGRLLATGDFNGTTSLWNLATGKIVEKLRDPTRKPQVDSIAFSPGGTTLAAGDDNGSIYLWNLTTRRLTATFTDPGPKHNIGAVAFSPDGTTLAAGDNDGSTYLWDLTTRTVIAPLTDPRGQGVDAVAITRNGAILAAGDNDGSTYLWDLTTRTIIATLTDPKQRGVNTVAFSPDGKSLATGDNNTRTYLWKLTDR
jgi:WD40 repeat protein